MEGKNKRGGDGYMTVEASLIMPIVLLVICFVIYAGFYQHDRCIMEQAAYRAALRGSSLYGADKEEKYRAAEDTLKELTKDCFAAMNASYEIVMKDRLTITSEGTLKIPLSGLARLVGAGEWTAEKEIGSGLQDPVFFIRVCRRLELGEEKD